MFDSYINLFLDAAKYRSLYQHLYTLKENTNLQLDGISLNSMMRLMILYEWNDRDKNTIGSLVNN